MDIKSRELNRISELAQKYRSEDKAFATWAQGYGVIKHNDQIQVLMHEMAEALVLQNVIPHSQHVYRLLSHADRITNAAMWLVVHMTFAKNVYLDGRPLGPQDFKDKPEGHTGGSLNMVPAFVGYLTANAISGFTRAWLMGQGHSVAAIWACNVFTGNLSKHCAKRYPLLDKGLSKLCRDFYSYAILPDGHPEACIGSHVNASTAGGLIEGGYLGFAELLYVHMPLPGERLVAFLSDGAFEEQRGGDWAPRWWRAQDSGIVTPILINNGRRIDQRSTMAQQGGTTWLKQHLNINSFDPIIIDGRDPAWFVWAIIEMEQRLIARGKAAEAGEIEYPIRLPYAIAESIKGAGFVGEGTNLAHGVPLKENPKTSKEALQEFNQATQKLFVPLVEIQNAVKAIGADVGKTRSLECENAMAKRGEIALNLPKPQWRSPGENACLMDGIDQYFVDLVRENPHIRVRVGNPDELRSNHLNQTLDMLKHRVSAPEPGIAESIQGRVITVLNEEAVVCAALGNKGGLNLVATYEAFAVKMLGAIRQELTFSRQQKHVGRPPKWISVPVIATSHTWENGKNEYSHQDTTFCEALLGEMSDVSRVFFPADFNSAVALMHEAYASHGQIWTVVAPKNALPVHFDREQATDLIKQGGAFVKKVKNPQITLITIGAYQLNEALHASKRLDDKGILNSILYLIEPAVFRLPRDDAEAHGIARDALQLDHNLADRRIILCHGRPEVIAGVLRPLDTGKDKTKLLGYINRGGTLDVFGMLFANRCTWAHAILEATKMLDRAPSEFLTNEEVAAVQGRGDPNCLRWNPPYQAPRRNNK